MNPQALMDLPVPAYAAELLAPPPVEPVPAVAIPARPAPAPREPLTPFLAWSDDGSFAEVLGEPESPPLLVALMREPREIAALLLEPAGLQRVVLTSLGAALACTLFRAAWMGGALRFSLIWPALELGVGVLLGAAAALGPVYAASVLVSARVPLARLGGAILAALAVGSLLLTGLAPPVYLAWRLDPVGLGPYAVLAAFLLVAAVTGARIHRLLFELARLTLAAAQGPAAKLSPEVERRVGVVARVACMVLGLTTTLAFVSIAGG
jgi:hypothetical protein